MLEPTLVTAPPRLARGPARPWRPKKLLLWGAGLALAPFVVNVTVYSYRTSNGRLTSFSFVDYGAIALGVLAIIVGLVALSRGGRITKSRRLPYRIATIAIALMGAFQLARGTGAFIDPEAFVREKSSQRSQITRPTFERRWKPIEQTRPAPRKEISAADRAKKLVRGAVAKAKSGKSEGALADLTAAIQLHPTSIAYKNRGLVKAHMKDHAGALVDLTKSLELNPRDANALFQRARLLARKREVDRAIADYTASIELDPQPGVFYNRALLHEQKGNLEAVIADYSSAIELAPNWGAAVMNRAIARQDANDLDGALADYTRAIELGHRAGAAHSNRAMVKEAKNDLDGARADYDRAIEIDPKDAIAFNNRGYLKFSQGDKEGALADYDRALELDPNDTYALSNRAELKHAMGDLEGAKADLARVNELKGETATESAE